MERRIAAILAADMVGFSRLIELDEAGTLARQKRHRLELIDPTIRDHHGRIIKLTGDGLIAEFNSVVEAMQAAVLVQRTMPAREAEVPENRRIRYRIAINLGDVVFDEGDIYGDGVNIAARLEALAEPGGIVVSGTAHDMLKSQVGVGYRPLGEKRLKNIATPVRVFQVTDGAASPRRRLALRRLIWPGAAAMAAAAVAGWLWTRPDFTPVDPAEMALDLPKNPRSRYCPSRHAARRNRRVGWQMP
ncbi:adenylate/guanylate cyclase domain-containing protein [Ruegeria marina]|uniref:Adenylate cyclase, class 3 n=1 Tax=Ruegeria marina TaxID=639004 RepID=A0A1G7C5R3_9RHOB|nr:adenylate/guanylate cyclase domain-containing protein [Ruegeria marina]SDE34648.1 Adenylate cyclase, class 3 [Ruegeria marina]